MKKAANAALIIVGLFILSSVVATNDARLGLILGLALLIVPGFAAIRPISRLGLGHRGFNIALALLVGLIGTIASLGLMTNPESLDRGGGAAVVVSVEPTTVPTEIKSATAKAASEGTGPSEAALELKRLFEELQEFKGDPEFHTVGFAACCRFNAWHHRVKNLSSRAARELIREVGFGPVDLFSLGMEYMGSRGRPTEYTLELEPRILAGLAPQPEARRGEGVVLLTDRACYSLESIERWQAALSSEKFGEADAIITGQGCPRVYEKTVVTGPLDRRNLTWEDGSVSTFVRVATPEGIEVWIQAGTVEFAEE